MPTPSLSHSTTATRPAAAVGTSPCNTLSTAWRCTDCGKLLGVRRERRMHIRFARGHEYLVAFPVTATCRGCGTLNHAPSSAAT